MGQGGYGSIFKAKVDKYDDKELLKRRDKIIIKVQSILTDEEKQVLEKCIQGTRSNTETVQRVFDFFKYGRWHFIVMERLGASLWDIRDSRGPFSLKCIAQIGIYLVEKIKILHSWGFVHQDIKTDNILTRYKSTYNGEYKLWESASHDIYLIDFG